MTYISTSDFHYGPMIPGDRKLKLLPEKLEGLKCLELGCGAAQNSIYLAKKGAKCTAFDIAEMQLAMALELMREEKVEVNLHRFSMDGKWTSIKGPFGLIHSSFGLPFSQHPKSVVNHAASLLKRGGTLIFSLEHPVAASERILMDEELGVFLNDYFHPLPKIRVDENNEEIIRSCTYPIGTMTKWITDAGLKIEKIVEPKAQFSNLDKIPYVSDAWIEELSGLENVPPVVIFVATK